MHDQQISTIQSPDGFTENSISENTVVVVIDVFFFSTSTVLLGEHGVQTVIPINDTNKFDEYDDSIPAGGEDTNSDRETFHNIPQNIFTVFGMMDDVPDTVVFYSDNGAKRVVETTKIVEQTSNVELLIGSVRNSISLAEFIQQEYEGYDVVLYCAGSQGLIAPEDVLGASIIQEELVDNSVSDQYTELFEQLPLQRFTDVGPSYNWISEEDIYHATHIRNSSIIPQYNSGELVLQSS